MATELFTNRSELMKKIQADLDRRNAELLARLEYNNRLKAEEIRKQRLLEEGSEDI